MRGKLQKISIILIILLSIGCRLEKGKNMNKEEKVKKEQEECMLSVEEQRNALKEFEGFCKELLSKAEDAKDLTELKEYFVSIPGFEKNEFCAMVRPVTVKDLITVLKNPDWVNKDNIFEKSVICISFIKVMSAKTIVDGDDGYFISLEFVYNGIKKRWEIFNFEIMPNP
ncbi:MAG TPA: hypothetical protein PLZ38_10340 [Spirochaetota bacterium]|nr:hypothetical protein [Spirochaetota bacterium]